jgi:hypothetical protein
MFLPSNVTVQGKTNGSTLDLEYNFLRKASEEYIFNTPAGYFFLTEFIKNVQFST